MSPPKLGRVIQPYAVYNVQGVRIGVIGLGNISSLNSSVEGDNSLGLRARDAKQAVNDLVRVVRPQVDLVVLLSHLGQNPRAARIALPSSERIDFVEIAQIAYCQGDSNYTHVKVGDQAPVLVAKTLKEFEELLSPHGFFRTHQSWLVNLDFVVSFVRKDGGYALMRDGAQVPVAQQKRKQFLEKI